MDTQGHSWAGVDKLHQWLATDFIPLPRPRRARGAGGGAGAAVSSFLPHDLLCPLAPTARLFPVVRGLARTREEDWGAVRRDQCPLHRCRLAREEEWAQAQRGPRVGWAARDPYPRLGPLGTNQGPAMPMRPQNVVKMTTGRAKECAVMARRGMRVRAADAPLGTCRGGQGPPSMRSRTRRPRG